MLKKFTALFTSVSILTACSSPPKINYPDGADRIPINRSFTAPEAKPNTDRATQPSSLELTEKNL